MTTIEETAVEEMTMAGALNSALGLALAADETVLLLGEDIADPSGGVVKVTKGLSTTYGASRVRATPIAEQAIVGTAIGAALAGYRPVAEVMFFDFMAVCMDQVVNHAAKLRYMSGGRTPVPITIRTMIGGGRFGAQHTQSLEAWFMHVPGLKVVMPSNPADAKGLLTACIEDDDPCVFIENSALMFAAKGPVPTDRHVVPLGSASVVRPGRDVTLVCWGTQVAVGLEAATVLATEGIDVEVIDLRSLVPLDLPAILESAARTRRVVVAHNATAFCGPGAELASLVHEHLWGELAAPVVRLGAPYAPIPFSEGLEVFPVGDDVIRTCRDLMRR